MPSTTLAHIHLQCASEFKGRLFAREPDGSPGVSNACEIYDALVGDCSHCQDCIGENFNHLLRQITAEWFDRYTPGEDLDYYFCNYVLLLNLCVERVHQILNILHRDGNFREAETLRTAGSPTLMRIRWWANFYKHPKQFLFSHSPQHRISGRRIEADSSTTVVDDAFVFEHYRRKDSAPIVLERNTAVVVLVPDLVELTKGFCAELNAFFAFICSSASATEFLRQCSIIKLPSCDATSEDGLSATA